MNNLRSAAGGLVQVYGEKIEEKQHFDRQHSKALHSLVCKKGRVEDSQKPNLYVQFLIHPQSRGDLLIQLDAPRSGL